MTQRRGPALHSTRLGGDASVEAHEQVDLGRALSPTVIEGRGLVPRPYDQRHSFASLLPAEGRQPVWVARQLGHSLTVLLSTYAHLIEEYAELERIDPDAEIITARRSNVRPQCFKDRQ